MGPYGCARSVEAMGRQDGPPLPPDHALRAQEFAKRHRHVTIHTTPAGWEATWIEAAAGPGDGEVIRHERAHLGHLLDYLEGWFDGLPHKPEPKPGTIYSVDVGPNTGHPADPARERHYPMEAHCAGCGEIIRLGQFLAIGPDGEWRHTGRRPGEDPE